MALAPKPAERPPDLTTTRAPFIEEARAHGEIYIIDQPYELYSDENQATWGRLLERMHDPWARYANRRFLEGMDKLQLSAARIPHLDDINRFMQPLTGFRARAVSGYVPSYVFFDCLRRREFPTTVTIRDGKVTSGHGLRADADVTLAFKNADKLLPLMTLPLPRY